MQYFQKQQQHLHSKYNRTLTFPPPSFSTSGHVPPPQVTKSGNQSPPPQVPSTRTEPTGVTFKELLSNCPKCAIRPRGGCPSRPAKIPLRGKTTSICFFFHFLFCVVFSIFALSHSYTHARALSLRSTTSICAATTRFRVQGVGCRV
jgi:hypothetical protein